MNDRAILERAAKMGQLLQAQHPVQAAMLQKNLRRYAATQQFLTAQLGENYAGRVLDYGCGFPMLLSLLRQGGFNAIGYEPYAEPGHLAVAECLGISPYFFTALPVGEQFDLVLMIDVIEHLSILRPTMTDVLARIRPGGYLAISTPNGLRFGQWLSFVRRKTAHPTAIAKFLETDNNYTHHQREFTRPELALTMRHYGLEVVSFICQDTTSSRQDLDRYSRAQGKKERPATWRSHVRDWIQRSLPADWQNNFFLLARKPAAKAPQ